MFPGRSPFGQNPMMPNMGQLPNTMGNPFGHNPMSSSFGPNSMSQNAFGQHPMMGHPMNANQDSQGELQSKFEAARARKQEDEERLKRENPEAYARYQEQQKQEYAEGKQRKNKQAEEMDQINQEFKALREELTKYHAAEGWFEKVKIIKRHNPRLDCLHISMLVGTDYFGFNNGQDNRYTSLECDKYRLEIFYHLYEKCTQKDIYAVKLAPSLFNQSARDELHAFVKNPHRHHHHH